jgi:hypothetical protein
MVIIISITLDHLYEQAVANKNRATEPHYEAVQRVVKTLTSKTSSLPGEYREDALKLVKGLAFINFTGQEVNKGIHIRELVEGLDLAGKERYARELIYQLREITGGQFIDQFGEDYFTLDLVHCIDYDEVLRKKANLLSREDEIKGLVLFLQKAFDLDDSKRVSDNLFYDYFYWPARNGFQQVVVAFNESRITEGAPALVINMNSSQEKSPEARKVIINLIYSQSLGSLIKELMVALNYTESSNYPTAYLKLKKRALCKEIEERLVTSLNDSGIISSGQSKTVSQLVGRSESLKGLYSRLKQKLFKDIFEHYYRFYPAFPFEINAGNIKDRIENTIIALLADDYNSDTRGVLQSLSLLDQQGNLDISSSCYLERIIRFLKEEVPEKVPVDRVFSLLKKEPYGLQKELIYLLLVILAYLGVIRVYRKDEIGLGVNEIKEYFLHKKTLFSSGLDKLAVIGYIKFNDYHTPESSGRLFSILGLKQEYLAPDYNPYLVLKGYMEKINGIKEKIAAAKKNLEQYLQDLIPGLDEGVIRAKITNLEKRVLNKLFAINTVVGLQKLSLSDFELEELEVSLRYIDNLVCFLDYLNKNILPDYRKLFQELKDEENEEELEQVTELMRKAWERIDNQKALNDLKKNIEIY